MHAPGLSVAGGVVITRTAQKQMSCSERENERPPSKLALKCSGSYGPARPSRRERMMAVVSDKALGRLKCHGQDSIELGICGWLTYKLT